MHVCGTCCGRITVIAGACMERVLHIDDGCHVAEEAQALQKGPQNRLCVHTPGTISSQGYLGSVV